MDAATGRELDGLAHLRQSVGDVLTTRLGTRLTLRTYGSDLLALVDRPLTAETLTDLYAATAEAIARWEPRLALTSVRASAAGPGSVTLDLAGAYRPTGETVTLTLAVG